MRLTRVGLRSLFDRRTAKKDALAGVVLGVESVPDGLASGLIAGVNPVAGLYAYLFGLAGGALFTSTTMMAVQGTGAMAIIVADVPLSSYDDPVRALCTLTVLTGAVMVAAGVLRLGNLLRFVSTSVMTGFVAAVGINIVLGQLDDFTGYDSTGTNRITRAFDLLLHLPRIDVPTALVGAVTIAGVVGLQRTRLGAMGLVVAVVAGSALAAALDTFGHPVALVADVADVPGGLPVPVLPDLGIAIDLLLPAVSLAFVGLVQGAGVAAGFPNTDGSSDTSRDFVGQGAGNIASGLLRGMPVGGSMSASALVSGAGAQTRFAMLTAALVMAGVVTFLADAVGRVAMPALAGLLIVVGTSTVKPRKLLAVGSTGPVPLTVMLTTLVLTLIIPLQFAVLVGVGMSVLLFVIGQSSRLVTRRLVFGDDGRVVETSPPATLPPGEVVVLQPYGPMFFASAATLRTQLPEVNPTSRRSVVILRLRGAENAGATLLNVLDEYATALRHAECKLVVVTDNQRLLDQLVEAGALPRSDVVLGTRVVSESTARAHDEAAAWVGQRPPQAPEHPAPQEPDHQTANTDDQDRHQRDPHQRKSRRADPDWGDVPPEQRTL